MSICRANEKPRKTNKTVACLITFCVFLLIVCVCLMTVLVFVGKYILYNKCDAYRTAAKDAEAPLATPFSTNYWRLPNDTEPILYDLTLLPDLFTGLYKGSVNVTLQVNAFRKDLVVHSDGLAITEVSLAASDLTTFPILNVRERAEYQVIVITTKRKILPGLYYLFIKFEGRLFGKLKGFYRSHYKNATGGERQIATSKFEPTYARQAYPCFDEPNLKAKYKVHLLKPKDSSYIALSNFPVASIDDYDNDHQLVSFDETVSMSTYLSCFIVSDFTHTTTSFDNNGTDVPLKVYASPANLEKTKYAGEVGKKVIEHYVKYFQISYPLPKLDLVAIPDFVSGAMEHWGLVTFRETSLLYTNTTHSSANKQRVATVIAHELAHSWFGNLVTMDWWNELWLNEGFASYIEYKGVLAAEPTWGMLELFITTDLHPVLSLDSTLSSHPIVQTVETPDQITEIFDTISYNKGASVLRMLEATVGEDNFQQAVKNYLNRYAFGNAVTKDLLKELQILMGDKLDVNELMDTFTIQMGYPILTVAVSGDNYTLTQKRFLKDPDATYKLTDSKYRYRWSVPVTYVTDLGKQTEPIIFKYSEDQLTIRKPTGAKWLKFNSEQIGYYRVNYPLAEWEKLIANYDALSQADRTHLLEETFAIAEADQLNYTVPLQLSKKLSNEIALTPWTVASSKLLGILDRLRNGKSAQEAAFKEYLGRIVTPAYKNLTWTENENDGHQTRLARVTVLGFACAVDHKVCLEEAQTKFNTWIQTKESISPDIRSLVYNYGVKNVSESAWNEMLQIYLKETDASEKMKLMVGLTSIENEDLLKKFLELAKNETVVRGQDYFSVLISISRNPKGTDLVWNFVRSNWEYLVNRFTLNDRYLGSLIPSITSSFSTPERQKEIQDFFEKYPNAGAGQANRKSALETIQNNIRWMANYKGTVEDWIMNNSDL